MNLHVFLKGLLLLAAGTAGVAGTAVGQRLTVEEYRAKVVEYNRDVKQAREAVKAAAYALKGIRAGFYPKVDVGGNYSYRLEEVEFMEGVDMKHDNYAAEATVSQNVYAGSEVRKRRDAAVLQEAIARLGEELTTENVVYAADVSYWTVAANESRYRVAGEFTSIVKELAGIVQKRFEEGAISKTDLLMVQTRMKEAELQLSAAAMDYRTAMQSLKIMMGASLEAKVQVADTIVKPVLVPVLQPLEVALRGRADYRIAEQEVLLARQQTSITRSRYLPRLAVGLRESWGTPMINVDGKEKFTTSAFASVSVPVFNWGEKRQYVRQGQALEISREWALSKVRDQVKEELANVLVRLAETRKRVEIANSTLQIARENLKLNTFSYNEGKLPILDVLSAQATWLQAYTNLVGTHYQFKITVAEYEKIVGRNGYDL